MIKINSLEKAFGNERVLKGIDMTFEKGKIYGVIGQSGSGKSTLLRCINGLIPYDKGSIEVNGVEVAELNRREMRNLQRNIGMIFQNFSLLTRLNVYDNIALPMKWWKYKKADIDKRVEELLELVKMPEKKKAYPHELSGGQKQRVAIARALAMNPEIILCDEATSALDPNIAATIMELLTEINKKMNITIIIVSHQLDLIERYCDEVYVLSDGEVKIQGKSEDVFTRRNEETLQELMGVSSNGKNVSGKCYMTILLRNQEEDESVFSKMAMDTGVYFSVVEAKSVEYRSGVLFQSVISAKEDDIKIIQNWLDENAISWKMEEENHG